MNFLLWMILDSRLRGNDDGGAGNDVDVAALDGEGGGILAGVRGMM